MPRGPQQPTTPAPDLPDARPPATPTPQPTPQSGRPARRPTAAEQRGAKKGSSQPAFLPRWSTWWHLNRWGLLPQRGELLARAAVTTPASSGEEGLTRRARHDLIRTRRALVARQAIVPRLLELLEPKARESDEVVAAALIALGKLTTDDGPRALLHKHATDARQSDYVRESAALALGLLRRSADADRMAADTTDLVRMQLLRLADDKDAPWRTRAFALYAVGLLADQPYGSVFGPDGTKIALGLGRLLEQRKLAREIRSAALTAIGLQPAGALPPSLADDLGKIVAKGRLHRVRWSDGERSHALTALARLGARGWTMFVYRILGDSGSSTAVRRAAYLALSGTASTLSGTERTDATDALAQGLLRTRDPLTYGLGLIALGRALAGQPQTEPALAARRELLLASVRRGPATRRGYGALALGFAAGGETATLAKRDEAAMRFRTQASAALVRGLEARRGDARLQAAYAVGLGLLGDPETVETLCKVVRTKRNDQYLRSQAAVALAQLGTHDAEALKTLRAAVREDDADLLRSEAALALSLYAGGSQAQILLPLLESAGARRVAGPLATALGTLGDPNAAPALLKLARSRARPAYVRAQVVAALGLLCDPEPRPSLLRISTDANYTGASNALYELLDIL